MFSYDADCTPISPHKENEASKPGRTRGVYATLRKKLFPMKEKRSQAQNQRDWRAQQLSTPGRAEAYRAKERAYAVKSAANRTPEQAAHRKETNKASQ